MNKTRNDAFNEHTGFMPAGMLKNPIAQATGALSGWMRYAGYLQSEAMGFIRERFRRDVGAMERLARCRKPEEYIEEQANFLAELYSDYARESVKIAGLFGDIVQTARAEFAGSGSTPVAGQARERK